MKSVGITGPAGAGKTTLFRAVTSGHSSENVGAVAVPDQRLDVLVTLHASKKRVPAQIEVHDVHAGARTQASAVAKLREMDAILIVAPAFGGLDPTPAVDAIKQDHVIADMGPFETRLERARKDTKARLEIPTLEKALSQLNDGRFLGEREWESDELKLFSSLAPITLKPHIVVVNVDEKGLDSDPADFGFPAFVADASLEAEVAGMTQDEASTLLEAYGVSAPVLRRVVEAVYRLLDLITFFTTSDKESRAWEVKRGARAPEAAGTIHSDMQRGFIRAEVVAFEKLVEAGSWDKAKANGLIRVEGKGYEFKEGDVTHFRFGV